MPITAFYASLLVLLLLILSARVITYRRAHRISLSDGEDPALLRRIRAHGNCAEYAPIGIVMLAIAESLGPPALALHALGIALVLGRLIHAYGVGGPAMNFQGRVMGMVLTLTALGLLAALCLVLALMGR